ncbi:MAG: DNA primase [Desulfovibrio sp.]|jgi:DNA primase|nr:DNA primase [Desulfovibrio sp.]
MRKSGSSAVREIKARIGIVELVRRWVDLRRAGNRWVGPCPFHQESKPSFSVNEEEGFFYCFGCQAAGDIFDFHSRITGSDFRESLAQLAEEAGVVLEASSAPATERGDLRKNALRMHDFAKEYFRRNLFSEAGADCRAYLEQRGTTPDISEKFELGWSLPGWSGLADALRRAGFNLKQGAESGLLKTGERGSVYDVFRARLIFPVRNTAGRVIAFGGRIIGDEDAAKYINSPDSPLYKKGENLFGLYQARRAIAAKKTAVLTEGYMDTLTLHQFGYDNACAVLGTALTVEQTRRLGNFCSDIELLFDGDAAGRKAALRACTVVLGRGLNCRVVCLPDGEDIDSLLHAQGTQAFEELRRFAPEGLDFCIRSLSAAAPREALDWVKSFLQDVEQPELVSRFASRLCRGLDLDERELRRSLPARSKKPSSAGASAAGRESGGVDKDALDRRIMSFVVRCPQHIPALRDAGAMLLLTQDWALSVWEKTASCAPAYDPDEVLSKLDDKEREFWWRQRVLEEPLRDNQERELADICRKAAAYCAEKQDRACRQAMLGQKDKNAYDPELLKALNESLLRKRTLGSADGQH